MIHIKTTAGLKSSLEKLEGKNIGMVPTMGALHAGHTSLVERSVGENDVTVVSIFVNPTQFNDDSDLLKYPRAINSDLSVLSGLLGPGDIVFTPAKDDIYEGEKIPPVNLGHLDRIMEGKHRPGHFMGVVRIVKILLDLCQPQKAYFGLKDFQQLAVIRTLVKQTDIDTEIIGCPIVREANGLAMSSRNTRLSDRMREKAGIIYQTLKKYQKLNIPFDIEELKTRIITKINDNEQFNVEYFEIVDDNELKLLQSVNDIKKGNNYSGCIAVYAGEIRLIDNIQFSFQFSKG